MSWLIVNDMKLTEDVLRKLIKEAYEDEGIDLTEKLQGAILEIEEDLYGYGDLFKRYSDENGLRLYQAYQLLLKQFEAVKSWVK